LISNYYKYNYKYEGAFIPLLLNEHHAMKAYWGNGSKAPCIVDIGIRWRWMVSFTPRSFWPRERDPGTHCV